MMQSTQVLPMISRKLFMLGALIVLLIFGAFLCFVKKVNRIDGPNIILISIDSLRADHLRCYGYERDTSLHIDALAKEGVMFLNAFSHAPHTTASHMSILTSLHHETHKIAENKRLGHNRLDKITPTLAEILKRNGYATAAFVGGLNVGAYRGFDKGFNKYSEKNQIKNVISWINAQRRKKFFLFFHTHAIHHPYFSPEPYNRSYDPSYRGAIFDAQKKLERKMRELRADLSQKNKVFWQSVNKEDPRDVNFLAAQYDAAIKFMDQEIIGRLVDKLKELGIYENTLIIFTADHGEAFKEHDNFTHNDLFVETLHVPLIMVCGKLLPGNKAVTHLARLIDIMPTILEISGIKADIPIQGRSLVPAIKGQDLSLVCYSSYEKFKAIRNDAYTYIENSGNGTRYLFDRQKDPGEKNNIFKDNPELADKFKKEMYQETEACNKLAEKYHPIKAAPLDSRTRKRLAALGYLQ